MCYFNFYPISHVFFHLLYSTTDALYCIHLINKILKCLNFLFLIWLFLMVSTSFIKNSFCSCIFSKSHWSVFLSFLSACWVSSAILNYLSARLSYSMSSSSVGELLIPFCNGIFYGHTCSIWKFLGQGLNPSHSCGNARYFNPHFPSYPSCCSFLTHCATAGTLKTHTLNCCHLCIVTSWISWLFVLPLILLLPPSLQPHPHPTLLECG